MASTSETVLVTGASSGSGRALVVPGWPNKIGAFMVRFAPRPVARAVAGWLNQ